MAKQQMTDEEKQAREMAKAEKARVRELKRAEREANRPPKHQAKLDRAMAQLPVLSVGEGLAVSDLTEKFNLDELEKIASHLNFHVRSMQTHNAVSQTLEVGQTVRIKSGSQKHLGKVGVVSRAQRIRCYVTLPNVAREVYLFTSDVELLDASTEGEAVAIQDAESENQTVAEAV